VLHLAKELPLGHPFVDERFEHLVRLAVVDAKDSSEKVLQFFLENVLLGIGFAASIRQFAQELPRRQTTSSRPLLFSSPNHRFVERTFFRFMLLFRIEL
jgi:hypothetical protein